ncbi:EAL domain-containing protein [Halorhodospira neutriphila]|uniref:Diguanylate cyclase/phosphodiesterase with PAS/PAC and GAF sensor(S) n=1 Tax=Halorhodospira neutriphila TaxID=168379 RepID=A0ABS1E4S3_9GAMM|nr:EAL domain-containing protein [Halorhodospira neutriphila]MBK1726197.1 hypothetical protein [Halorhodospira neutriphila]
MQDAPIPSDDEQRLAALYDYGILDTPAEAAFERLTRVACEIFQAPIATVTLVDRDRQWFKSVRGIDDCETARSISFCGHVVYAGRPLRVEDARQDERFHDNPLVRGPPYLRAYLGVPLTTPRGFHIGVVCVQDTAPRGFAERELRILQDLASVTMDELELRRVRQALERERALFIAGPTVIVLRESAAGWPIRYASPNAAEVLGHSPEALVAGGGQSYLDLVHPADRARVAEEAEAGARQGEHLEHQPYRLRRGDGTYAWVHDSIVVHRDAEGRVDGYHGYLIDITERVELEAKLRRSAILFEEAQEGILITDAQGRITAVNRTLAELTGYSEAELDGCTPACLHAGAASPEAYRAIWQAVHRQGHWSGELQYTCRDGSTFPGTTTLREIRDAHGARTHYIELVSDASRLKAYQRQLERMMHVDPLTELPNRLLFQDRLEQALAGRHRDGQPLAVVVLDLRDFRAVNDSLGQEAGDQVLAQVGRRLQQVLREEDTVARLSGDEFGILLPRLGSVDDAAPLAERITAWVEEPFQLEGHEVPLVARSGVSVYFGQEEASASTFLEQADAAMYEAKLEGVRYRFFSEELTERAQERIQLTAELRQALAQGQLAVHYQPQLDLASGEWVGVEALARWPHPQWGWISPGRFIPVAERAGLIGRLGGWVLEQACTQAQAWLTAGVAFGRIGVNVAAPQLTDPGLVEAVTAALAQSGLPAERLELEITESLLVAPEPAVVERLQALRQHGVSVAIDDFGTGYSALSYLKDLPVDRLKIDRSFIDGVPEQADVLAITRAILALGQSLGFAVVAEGIEEEHQRAALLEEGCREGQGFLFARPGAATALR